MGLGLVDRTGAAHAYGEDDVLGEGHCSEPQFLTVVPFDNFSQRTQRSRAPGFEGGEDRALGGDGRACGDVVERGQGRDEGDIRRSTLDCECPLTWRGKHLEGVEGLGDLVEPAQARESGAGQDDGVVVTLAHLADAGVDVAADAHQVEAQAEGGQLADPPRRTGAEAAADRELAEGEPVASHEDVARVLPERYAASAMPSAGAVGGPSTSAPRGRPHRAGGRRAGR